MASIHVRTIRWETKDGEERTGRRYQARYRDRSGQEHARLFKLKRDAQALAQRANRRASSPASGPTRERASKP